MIPSKVKVAGVTYTIEEKEQVIIDSDMNYGGCCDFDFITIELKESLPTERKEETFLCEMR